MKRLLHYRVLLIFCVSLLLLVGLAPVQAQADNLLTNPGFEPPYNTLDGDPERTVADGWSPWHITRTDGVTVYGLPQPEYQEVAPNADRIRSDSNAQEIFGTFANPVGGVFQRVVEGITPQAEYRFSLYAWVWSTSREDILDESEDDADVTVEVGIDPTGGTDATSSAIQWSLPAEQYDAYRQYSVTATATSNAVTVFVRIKIRDPKARTSIYLDDAELASTALPVVPTNTAPAPTDEPTPTQEGAVELPIDEATPTDEATLTNEPVATDVPPTETAAPTATEVIVPTNTPAPTATRPSPESTSTVGGTGGPQPLVPISEDFPNTLVHTVQRGDIVAEIAVLYGSTTQAIIQANGLDDRALIYVGQGLIIPVRLAAPATAMPTGTPIVIIVTATAGADTSGNTGGTGGPITGGIPTTGGNYLVYTVQYGDTLSGIARSFNTTITALAQINGIVNVNLIRAGQQVLIPGGMGGPSDPSPQPQPSPTPIPAIQTYSVQPGDTLYWLAIRFNVSVSQLIDANGIGNPNRLYVGQILVIPSAS